MMLNNPVNSCLNPRRVKNLYTGEDLIVPCGKCTSCMLNKGSHYAFQCECEAKVSKYVLFVTLTYANSYIPRMRVFDSNLSDTGLSEYHDVFDVTTPRTPDDESLAYLGRVRYPVYKLKELQKKCHLFGDIPYLRRRDLQLFIKRLRIKFPEYEIRYFATGEYGPETFRPHFHLLLFFNNPELIEPSDFLSLGMFPKWTWPKRKKVTPKSSDKLSHLEYAIRESWQYGIVDTELVTNGSASSYVAEYLNGTQPLPPFLALSTTKCFSVHSRFLGRKIFRSELASVLSIPAKDFVRGSLELGNISRSYTFRYENYHYYYPKCKGYAFANASRRLQLYKCFDSAVSCFSTNKPSELATSITEIVDCIHHLKPELGELPTDYFTYEQVNLAYLLHDFVKDIFPCDYDKIRSSIYIQLLTSRIFCENVRALNCSPEWYLSRIEQFYNELDYMHLTDWLESQQKYFIEDYADEGDIIYFYNNTDYNIEDYLHTKIYNLHCAEIKQKANNKIKHKIANDKNRIFLND